MGGCFTGCPIDKFARMNDLTTMPGSPPLTVTMGEPTITADGLVRRIVTLAVGSSFPLILDASVMEVVLAVCASSFVH
jgi:hypothetical protein